MSVENCALAIVANNPGGGAMEQRGLLCDNQLSISCVRNHESPKEQNKTINSPTRQHGSQNTHQMYDPSVTPCDSSGDISFQSKLFKPFQSHLCRPLVASGIFAHRGIYLDLASISDPQCSFPLLLPALLLRSNKFHSLWLHLRVLKGLKRPVYLG